MTKNQKRRLDVIIKSMMVMIILMIAWNFIPGLKSIEQYTLDFRYKYFNHNANFSDQIVLIDIDDESLKKMSSTWGRWPWPRRAHKDIIEFLMMGEPKSIIFDIYFTEAQIGSDDDIQLGEASKASGVTSHAMQFLVDSTRENTQHVSLSEQQVKPFLLKWKGQTPPKHPTAPQYNDYALPNQEIMTRTPCMHVPITNKDPDGIFRRMPIFLSYDNMTFPSLSLQGLLSLVSQPLLDTRDNKLLIYDGEELKWSVPINEKNYYQLHYYQGHKRPIVFRVGEVIDSARALQLGTISDPAQLAVNPLELKDKIVLIGASAAGLEDLKATPVGESYPGVLLHATAISNILSHDYLKVTPPWMIYLITSLLVLLTYLSILFLESIFLKALIPLTLIGIYITAALWGFKTHSLHLYLAMPLGLFIFALLHSFGYMTFTEGRERKKMTGTLSKYLSPDLAKQMADQGIDPTAEVGHKKELTILFSDIRGFTTLSEKLPPEMVVSVLNEYLEKMTDIIFLQKGTLDKFIGDAIMAFWGAPLDLDDHALRAVRTLFAMNKALEKLTETWKEKNYPLIKIGVGLNTGPVIVGNIGSEKRLDYTVIGDNVNLASRVEGLTKQYKVQFLIGEGTYEHVHHKVICRIIDNVQVKGKLTAVKIYEPLIEIGLNSAEEKKAIEFKTKFENAWQLYFKGDFTSALQEFKSIDTAQGGDGPSQVYIERCEHLIEESPQEWNGIYVAKSK